MEIFSAILPFKQLSFGFSLVVDMLVILALFVHCYFVIYVPFFGCKFKTVKVLEYLIVYVEPLRFQFLMFHHYFLSEVPEV